MQLLGEAQNDSMQRGQAMKLTPLPTHALEESETTRDSSFDVASNKSIVKQAAVLDGDLKILLVVL